jgi:hypothetical protein
MKHELSKMDFELTEEGLMPLLYSDPDWAVAQKSWTCLLRWASSRGGPMVSHLLALPSSLGAKSARKPIEMWRQQANLFEDVPDLLKFFLQPAGWG